tara:strand:- start:18465 stop:19478 length:1014 start_codon:yes stop_codon:yes gene_type:complete
MDILIIKLGALGDVLRTTTLIPALKQKFPKSVISFLTQKSSQELISSVKGINNLFFIESFDTLSLEGQLFDLIINLDDDELASKISNKLNSKKLIGSYFDNGIKYTVESSDWFDMGLASRFGKQKADELKILNQRTYQEIIFSFLELGDHKQFPPKLYLQDENISFSNDFFLKHKISSSDAVIGINTGSGGRWKDKKLPIEDTIDLINLLVNETKSKILLFGGPEEVERNKEILQGVSNEVIDAGCNNSLSNFASLINICDILVTSDSLALHVGVGLGKEVLAFFYPTSSSEIELYGKGIKIIAEGKSYCSYQEKCEYPPNWDLSVFIKHIQAMIKK